MSKSKKKVIKIVCIVIVAVVAVLLISAYLLFRHYVGLMDYQPLEETATIDETYTEEPETVAEDVEDSPETDVQALEDEIISNLENNSTELMYHENVINILLVGTDARDTTSRGRSDSMILVSINKETQQIVMTSIMRDIYLNIPGVGNNRINAAYNFGGPELLIETIESNFRISIDHYVRVNFDAFEKVIDTVGGVSIELTSEEIEILNSYLSDSSNYITSGAGTYQLNGAQALAYSRIRYTAGSDFKRTERQRTVLTAIISKSKNLSITELNSLLTVLLPQLTTNLTEGEIFSLVLSAPTILNYEVVSYRVPADGTWQNLTINRMAVLGIDFAANRQIMIQAIYGE